MQKIRYLDEIVDELATGKQVRRSRVPDIGPAERGKQHDSLRPK